MEDGQREIQVGSGFGNEPAQEKMLEKHNKEGHKKS